MLVKRVKPQMKAHFISADNSMKIIGFLAFFELACGTNHFHEGAAMWVLPHFVYEALADAPSSRTYAEKSFAPFAALVCNQEPRSRKLLRWHQGVVGYLLKMFASYRANFKYDALNLRNVQPSRKSSSNMLTILSLSRTKWRTCMTKGRLKMSL